MVGSQIYRSVVLFFRSAVTSFLCSSFLRRCLSGKESSIIEIMSLNYLSLGEFNKRCFSSGRNLKSDLATLTVLKILKENLFLNFTITEWEFAKKKDTF